MDVKAYGKANKIAEGEYEGTVSIVLGKESLGARFKFCVTNYHDPDSRKLIVKKFALGVDDKDSPSVPIFEVCGRMTRLKLKNLSPSARIAYCMFDEIAKAWVERCDMGSDCGYITMGGVDVIGQAASVRGHKEVQWVASVDKNTRAFNMLPSLFK